MSTNAAKPTRDIISRIVSHLIKAKVAEHSGDSRHMRGETIDA